jgi:fluoride exporter
MNLWVAVFLGGGVGSLVRYGISTLFLRWDVNGSFPWATLSANFLAAIFLAWLILRYNVQLPGKQHWQALLAIGFCGGFSTFSTFSYENYQLLRDGLIGYALLNVMLSVATGILVFYLFARTA